MQTALYFPYISVPKSSWFTQILLYWDRAASIVPESLQHGNGAISQYMSELIDLDLLEYVSPDTELFERHDSFAAAFLALVDARAPTKPGEPPSFTRIHTGKMGWSIFSQLERRGLANRANGPGWDSWWSVEALTADIYMTYLAGTLCRIRSADGEHMYPVTDRHDAVASLSSGAGSIHDRLRDLRYATIMNALPAPTAALPAREIIDFKDKHGEALARLRRHLDGRLVDIAAIEEAEHREIKARLAVDEICDEVASLREKMGKRNWPRIVLVGLGGVVGGALSVAAGVVTGGTSAIALGLAVGGGLISTGGAGYQAVEMLRAPAIEKDSPLAYAAVAPK